MTYRALSRWPPVIRASPVGQPPELPALLEKVRAGGPVDRAVHAAAPEKGRVRGVHDRVDVKRRDVAADEVEAAAHGLRPTGGSGARPFATANTVFPNGVKPAAS